MIDQILKILKSSAILLIQSYQLTSAFRQPCCRFYPSCSNYSIEVIKSEGLLRGLSLAIMRLLKCHPWHPGGIDIK